MGVKLKPSTKEYARDARGRMTNRWTWKHYTITSASNDELLKAYKSTPRKKSAIKKELVRRGIYESI